jgi:alanine dehydrogenase
MDSYVDAVEQAFALYGNGGIQMPPKVYLNFDKGDVRCMPVAIPALGVAGVKNVTVYPHNTTHPTVLGSITLLDAETGAPLAIMDGTRITNMRTGAQAETQLAALLVTCPQLERVTAYDINEENIQNFMQNAKHGLDARQAASVTEAVADADIVTTVTPVRKPVVANADIQPSTHINAIGADAEGKQELETALMQRARVVIDSWEQASHSGEINVPVANGDISRDDIVADIGEIVTGDKTGRTNAEEITVFDSTGLGVQDIVVAKMVYDKILANNGLCDSLQTVDFL